MVNLGWSAIPFPEALGGLDFGCKGLGAVFEQIGSKLGAAPLLSSIVLGGSVLELAGSAQQSEWLPALIAGERRIALALDEQPRHDPAGTALAARREGEGWVLTGDKVFVVDGLGADAFVVVARTAGSPATGPG
jgi:alkylation response protein AidB-like acyl-CoA dehydrogenase